MNKECEGAKDVERVTPARTEKKQAVIPRETRDHDMRYFFLSKGMNP